MQIENLLQQTIRDLSSPEAFASLDRDPYWPKWNSPWWQMCLLSELGYAHLIPRPIVDHLVDRLNNHYLKVFPIHAEEVPPGTDPYRQIMCLCGAGNIYQTLYRAGVDVEARLPWMKEWFFRYQLPDGGLNCDEKAYTKPVPKSSILSTIACLEAVLDCRRGPLTEQDLEFLERGAQYLLRQRLFRRRSTGEVADTTWLEVRFPRFFDYDILRGYSFLARWRKESGFVIPDDLAEEVEALIEKQMSPEGLRLLRYNIIEDISLNPTPEGGWQKGGVFHMPLMQAVSFEGALCKPVTQQWSEVKPRRARVAKDYEVMYANPIRVRAGEKVRVEKRETTPEWIGWIYVIDSRGIGGWITERNLRIEGAAGEVLRDYEATELGVRTGETLKVYFEEFGWSWCRDQHGQKGWVPSQNLTMNP